MLFDRYSMQGIYKYATKYSLLSWSNGQQVGGHIQDIWDLLVMPTLLDDYLSPQNRQCILELSTV